MKTKDALIRHCFNPEYIGCHQSKITDYIEACTNVGSRLQRGMVINTIGDTIYIKPDVEGYPIAAHNIMYNLESIGLLLVDQISNTVVNVFIDDASQIGDMVADVDSLHKIKQFKGYTYNIHGEILPASKPVRFISTLYNQDMSPVGMCGISQGSMLDMSLMSLLNTSDNSNVDNDSEVKNRNDSIMDYVNSLIYTHKEKNEDVTPFIPPHVIDDEVVGGKGKILYIGDSHPSSILHMFNIDELNNSDIVTPIYDNPYLRNPMISELELIRRAPDHLVNKDLPESRFRTELPKFVMCKSCKCKVVERDIENGLCLDCR
jgi:hypothetical protein